MPSIVSRDAQASRPAHRLLSPFDWSSWSGPPHPAMIRHRFYGSTKNTVTVQVQKEDFRSKGIGCCQQTRIQDVKELEVPLQNNQDSKISAVEFNDTWTENFLQTTNTNLWHAILSLPHEKLCRKCLWYLKMVRKISGVNCARSHFKYKVSCKINIIFLTEHGLSRYLIFDFILKFPSPYYLLAIKLFSIISYSMADN